MTKVTCKETFDNVWAKVKFDNGTDIRLSFGHGGERLSASPTIERDTLELVMYSAAHGWFGKCLGDKVRKIASVMETSKDADELAHKLLENLV